MDLAAGLQPVGAHQRHLEIGQRAVLVVGDIYQLDGRGLPDLDFATLFHVGEFRDAANDKYGALTDLEMTLVCADRLKPGGEIHFFTGSFAYDKAEAVGAELVKRGRLEKVGTYKSLMIYRRRA